MQMYLFLKGHEIILPWNNTFMMYNTDTVHPYVDVLLNDMEKAFVTYVQMYTYKLSPCPCNNV